MLIMPITPHAEKRTHSLVDSSQSSTGKIFPGSTLDKAIMLMKTEIVKCGSGANYHFFTTFVARQRSR